MDRLDAAPATKSRTRDRYRLNMELHCPEPRPPLMRARLSANGGFSLKKSLDLGLRVGASCEQASWGNTDP